MMSGGKLTLLGADLAKTPPRRHYIDPQRAIFIREPHDVLVNPLPVLLGLPPGVRPIGKPAISIIDFSLTQKDTPDRCPMQT